MVFKMKGSPMRRNFGIGASAFKAKPVLTTEQKMDLLSSGGEGEQLQVEKDVREGRGKDDLGSPSILAPKIDFERKKFDLFDRGEKQFGYKKGEMYSPWRKPTNIGIMPLVSGDKRSISGLSGTLNKSYQPLENLNLSGKLSGSARKFGDNIYSGGNIDVGGEWKPTEDLTIKGGLGGSVRGGGGRGTELDKRFNLNLDKKTDWGGFNVGYDSKGGEFHDRFADPDANKGMFKGGVRFNI